MPARKANSSGKWSQSIWDVTPAAGDDVFANGFTVEIDVPIVVSSLRTTLSTGYAAAGGTFTLLSAVSSVVANSAGFLAGTTTCVTGLLSTGTSFLTGNVTGGSIAAAHGVSLQGTGNLAIFGNTLGGSIAAAYGTFHNSSGNLTINGNVSGSSVGVGAFHNSSGNIFINSPQNVRASSAHGVQNFSVGSVYLQGNVLGGTVSTARGVLNSSAGLVSIVGNLSADVGPAVEQSSTGTVLIDGNIFASANANGVVSASTAARNEFTGALINSDLGRQALFVARYLLKPKVFESYTFHKNNETVNLFTFSEQFNNAAWTKTNTTISANASASPISTQTADRIAETTANAAHLVNRTFSTILSSVTETVYQANDLVFSVYAKASQRRYIVLGVDAATTNTGTTHDGANGFSVVYDLQSGTTTSSKNTGTGILTLSGIESIGNDWYRCMVEGKIGNATTPWNTRQVIAISDRSDYSGTLINNHIPSYTGNALSGIAVWGAQFEYNTLTPYVSSEVYQGFANRSVQPVTYYAPEAYSTSYVPHVSSVALGTAYAAVSALSGVAVNIPVQLSGTMVVPSEASVSFGTLVGQTTGTAVNTSALLQQVWNTNINTLTAANSLGARLKSTATVQEVGQQIQNLNL